MLRNKKHNPMEAELFIRNNEIVICFAFMNIKTYFTLKTKYQIKFNTLLYYENFKKVEFEKEVTNHSSDIYFTDVMTLFKKYTAKPCFSKTPIQLSQQIILYVLDTIFKNNIQKVNMTIEEKTKD